MDLIEGVYRSLKQKSSLQDRADKLGLSLEEYVAMKSKIESILDEVEHVVDDKNINYLYTRLNGESGEDVMNYDLAATASSTNQKTVNYNFENNEQTISVLSDNEPKSAEDILKIHDLDPKEWRVAEYWSKQKLGRWEVSAKLKPVEIADKQLNEFAEYLQRDKVYEIPEVSSYTSSKAENISAVISLQDMHIGKPGNEDVPQHAVEAVKTLLQKANSIYNVEECVLVIGGDLLQVDTFNETTTKGTPVETSETPMNAYIKAFDAMASVIFSAAQLCEKLKIVYIPGNHDRLSSFHLAHGLYQAFKMWKNIEFDVDYSERKVHCYGENMYCFEHGDVKSKENPLVYAVEFPDVWGVTKNRILYQGHYHHKKTMEHIVDNESQGFVSKIMPSLSNSDYFHYKHKFSNSRRAAILDMHDKKFGKVGEFIYNVI